MVRLNDVGISGRMWHLIANFLCGTLSQVRIGDSASQLWVDSGIAQGRVLSPLLFNVLVDTLAASIRSVVPGVRLVPSDAYPAIPVSFTQTMWFSCLSHKSICRQASMHVTLGAFAGASLLVWAQQSRPPWSSVPSGAAQIVMFISEASLFLLIRSTGFLASCWTPDLSWRAHVAHVSSRGDRLFHQSSAWCHGEGLPVRFTVSVFDTYVLSCCCFRLEFVGDDPPAIANINLALRRWCRQLLGWPRASPIAAIHWEVGIGDSLRLVLGRAFPLFGRLCALDPAGSRSPLPATIFRLCANVRGTWAHWCASALRSLSMAADFHGVRVDLATDLRLPVRDNPVYSRNFPFAWSRLWGLARWDHDPSVTGRSARHQNSRVGCRLCHADDGSLIHHLSACPCHIYARDVWAQSCGLSPCEASAWASHPWLFNPQHVANTPRTVRAHVRFVGQVCTLLESPTR